MLWVLLATSSSLERENAKGLHMFTKKQYLTVCEWGQYPLYACLEVDLPLQALSAPAHQDEPYLAVTFTSSNSKAGFSEP